MYYFVTELQSRPDGIVNSTITQRSNLANGLAYWLDRASKAPASTTLVKVALTLQDQYGAVIEPWNMCFDTLYEAPEES